ncbi:MAG: hypothetical protein ACRD5H_00240 [Nitrososphaerales archaeon]
MNIDKNRCNRDLIITLIDALCIKLSNKDVFEDQSLYEAIYAIRAAIEAQGIVIDPKKAIMALVLLELQNEGYFYVQSKDN